MLLKFLRLFQRNGCILIGQKKPDPAKSVMSDIARYI
jgi:hypothetical protein